MSAPLGRLSDFVADGTDVAVAVAGGVGATVRSPTRDLPPVTVVMSRVVGADDASTTWSHQLSPSILVALAHELYPMRTRGLPRQLRGGVARHGRSAVAHSRGALPRVVDAVAHFVASAAIDGYRDA